MQLMKSSQTKVFADTSALIHADERPRNIDGRLFSEGDPAGAYYIVRGVYAEGGTTVVMPVKIGAFGGRQSGWILVAAKPDNSAGSGGLTALSVADDAGRFTLSRSSGVLVNGQPITMETRFKRDEWLIISWTAPSFQTALMFKIRPSEKITDIVIPKHTLYQQYLLRLPE